MKTKHIFCITTVFVASFFVSAQDSTQSKTGWKHSLLTNLTLTLYTYSDNWAGGEYSAFSWAWQFNGTAEKALTPWLMNKNTLKLAFGQTALKDSTNFYALMLYDKEIDDSARWKNTIGLALTYSVAN